MRAHQCYVFTYRTSQVADFTLSLLKNYGAYIFIPNLHTYFTAFILVKCNRDNRCNLLYRDYDMSFSYHNNRQQQSISEAATVLRLEHWPVIKRSITQWSPVLLLLFP